MVQSSKEQVSSALVYHHPLCPVFSQPIVSRALPEMLKSHFIPTMEKLKKRSGKVVAEEEHLRMEGKTEVDSEDGTIRDEFAVLCRDLYAFYPMLIRYVDNNRYAICKGRFFFICVYLIYNLMQSCCPFQVQVAEGAGCRLH